MEMMSVVAARRETDAAAPEICNSAPIARNRRADDEPPVPARHIFRCIYGACSPAEERARHRLGSASCRRRSEMQEEILFLFMRDAVMCKSRLWAGRLLAFFSDDGHEFAVTICHYTIFRSFRFRGLEK
jgi:hypothetical protein